MFNKMLSLHIVYIVLGYGTYLNVFPKINHNNQHGEVDNDKLLNINHKQLY